MGVAGRGGGRGVWNERGGKRGRGGGGQFSATSDNLKMGIGISGRG